MRTSSPTFTLLSLCAVFALCLLGPGCQPSGEKPSGDADPAVSDGPAATEVAPADDPAPEAEKPATEEPAAEKPAAEKPAAEKPAAEKPAAEKPTAAPADTKDAAAASTAMPEIPLGLPEFDVPKDNPMTADKIALGKMLYFDKRLSVDESVSCATCHDPKMAWAEHTPTSTGVHKKVGPRNSPTVINTAYAPSQFWDGRVATLEEQASGPMENPIEMGMTMAGVVERIGKVPEYVEAFQKVYGTGVTEDGVVKAIAAFERTVLSGNSRYDQFVNGKEDVLNEQEKRGWELFKKDCASCHTPPLFSNYSYVNTGIGMDKEDPDKGRMEVTGRKMDMGKFRVPMLRDVEKTYPYFHDGSVKSLDEAVAVMAAGGKPNPNLSFSMKRVADSKLTKEQQADIVAFLKTLNGEYPVTEPPKLP